MVSFFARTCAQPVFLLWLVLALAKATLKTQEKKKACCDDDDDDDDDGGGGGGGGGDDDERCYTTLAPAKKLPDHFECRCFIRSC